jgi:hypothetical protein
VTPLQSRGDQLLQRLEDDALFEYGRCRELVEHYRRIGFDSGSSTVVSIKNGGESWRNACLASFTLTLVTVHVVGG